MATRDRTESGPSFADKRDQVLRALQGRASETAFNRLPNELLDERDGHGKSVMTHLFELTDPAMTPLAPSAGGAPRDLAEFRERSLHLAETIIDGLDRIGQSTQGSHGTCGPECISLLVNMLEPGRWTAMTRDLFELGHHQNTILVPSDINYCDANPTREFRDRVLQASIKTSCPPEPGATYSNADDRWTSRDGRDLGSGILTRSAAETLSALLGSHWVKTSDSRVIEYIINTKKEPFYASIRWSDNPADMHSLHALVITGIVGGRVTFRNPWGPSGANPVGRELTDPPRRTEDPDVGLESMELSEFMARFNDAAVPVSLLHQGYRERRDYLAARQAELKRDQQIDWDPLRGDPPDSAETYSDRMETLKTRREGYQALAREAYKMLADGVSVDDVRHVLNYVTPKEVDSMVRGVPGAKPSDPPLFPAYSEEWDAAKPTRGILYTILNDWRKCTVKPTNGSKSQAEWKAEREAEILTPGGEILSEGRYVRDTILANPYAPTITQRQTSKVSAFIWGTVGALGAAVSTVALFAGMSTAAPLFLSMSVMISTWGIFLSSRGETERDSLVVSTKDIFSRLKARQSLTYEDCLALVAVFKELPQLLFRGHFRKDERGEIVPVNRYTGFFDNLADRCTRSSTPVVGPVLRFFGRAWLNRGNVSAQLDMSRDFRALLQEMEKASSEIMKIAAQHAAKGTQAVLDANNRQAINQAVDQALTNIEPMLTQVTNPPTRAKRVLGALIQGGALTTTVLAASTGASYFGISAVPTLTSAVASWDIEFMKSAGEFLLRNSGGATTGLAVLAGAVVSLTGAWRELNDRR